MQDFFVFPFVNIKGHDAKQRPILKTPKICPRMICNGNMLERSAQISPLLNCTIFEQFKGIHLLIGSSHIWVFFSNMSNKQKRAKKVEKG